jgi:multidrug efflux system outer membrane protein
VTRRLVIACLALVATGCALGPNYKRPEVPTPPSWRELPTAESESLANTPWWEVFQDPQLQELVRIALQENKDLKIAVERVEEARARYGFTKADLWPKVDLNATGGRLRFNSGSLIHTPEGEGVVSEATETSIWSLTADASWEIDFFGRIRRATEAQKALFLGTQEARRSAVLALVADVARAYLELRAFDLQLEIARRTIESRREYVQLARDRFEGGLTPELDFRQAEAELRRVRPSYSTSSG